MAEDQQSIPAEELLDDAPQELDAAPEGDFVPEGGAEEELPNGGEDTAPYEDVLPEGNPEFPDQAEMPQEGDNEMPQEGDLSAEPQAVYDQEVDPEADIAFGDPAPAENEYQETAPAEQQPDDQPQQLYDDQQPLLDEQQPLLDEAQQEQPYESAQADQPYDGQDYGVSSYDQQPTSDLYGGYDPAQAVDTVEAEPAAPAAPAVDIDAILAEEREKHDQVLKLETRAREELEDMILRIEKHFKAEQAARKKAEELLQQAIAAEMDAKNKLEDVMKKRGQEQKLLDEERNAIKRERQALESMRQEFDNELQAARSEVAKAQEALAGSEERIRSAEQVERARLESEYQSKLATLQAENDRLREEMGYRVMVMQDEMEKWRQQASITANAVMEAKQEVNERKRELDNTKDKMDRLLDKLLVGRERNIELQGAISSNQRMLNFPGGMGGMGGMSGMGGMASMGMMGGKVPPLAQMPQGPWMNNMMPSMMPQLQQQSSGIAKLPPLMGPTNGNWSEDAASPVGNRSVARRATSQDHYRSGGEDSDGGNGNVKSKGKVGARNARSKPDRFAEANKDASRNAAMSRWN